MKEKIDSGTWKPGEKLPAEPQLAKEFGVSRATIREAMQELVYSGQINRVRGVGSFVGKKTISYGMNQLVSISDLIRQNGYESSICHVKLDVGRPEKKHAAALELGEFEPVYKVQRVFAADGKPIVYEETVYPCHLLPGVTEEDFYASSFEMMRNRGIFVQSSDGLVRPQRATPAIASLMKIPNGEPLLLMETVVVDKSMRKIVYVKDYFTQWFEFPIRRTKGL